MNKRDRMIQKIKAEPDQTLRLMKMVIFINENGSAEERNSMEKMIRKTVGYPEKVEA